MTAVHVEEGEDPDERSRGVFKAKIADETFSFRTFKFDDRRVSAAQVAEAFGAHPLAQYKVLQQLSTGEIETKRPTETSDLHGAGVERFFVIRSDRTFGFTIDGLSLEWPLATISGAHLRELALATNRQELVRVTAEGFKPVRDSDVVSFDAPETEEFRLVERKHTVTVYYRELPFEVERRRWTTEELMTLFDVQPGYKLDRIEEDGEFKLMKPGESVEVREGMEFTSHVPAGQSS